ncbi:unnamed protein product [Debaryomyces fabryi]|nr:unnamed protein product [Debaryomyces fabryi]
MTRQGTAISAVHSRLQILKIKLQKIYSLLNLVLHLEIFVATTVEHASTEYRGIDAKAYVAYIMFNS